MPSAANLASAKKQNHAADALQHLVAQLENDPSLFHPDRLRQRLDALDLLDAYLPSIPQTASDACTELDRRASAICARLEAANAQLYAGIRKDIEFGSIPDALLQLIHPHNNDAVKRNGMGYDYGIDYDYLDELIAGILQLEEPAAAELPLDSEQVFYQPTPARHIFALIGLTALTSADVLIDLGSGLGHVPLLVSICTHARTIGIELEPSYVERARQCALSLNLNRITFLQQDARGADLSLGTVFYLYTPFTGSILSSVLDRLRHEAATRPIRICSYGPCTAVIANEPWLEPATALEAEADQMANRIALFHSRD